MAGNNKANKSGNAPNRIMLSRTLILLLVCGIAAFIVLIGRLFQLQVLQHEELENAAVEQQIRETEVDSGRGAIYDTNMKILAMSADVSTIYISPAEIVMYGEDPVLIAENLSRILGVDYAKILDMTADTASWYKTVARKVEGEVADKVREFKNEHGLVGVKIEADTKRYYPYGSLACHVVGYVGFENTGLSGLEMCLDSVLTGSSGRIVRVKNAYGTDMLFTKYEDYYDAENGYSVVTTIDSTIQYYVEKHLKQAVEDYGVKNGAAAIAIDPKTGEILAMASLGNFDLNDYDEVSDEVKQQMAETQDELVRQTILSEAQQLMWRNKAVSDTYEPGSTFKIITLAMALEEGIASMNSNYYCGGFISVVGDDEGEGRHCWRTEGHGMQTLTQAVQHSCNVAMIQMGQEVGAETFYEYVDAFGFFNTTGIELAGESGSIWWADEVFLNPFNRTQLAAASFGQTFNITPLQLVKAVSACVNGGYLMQPYLVKEIIDEDGNIVSKTEPSVIRQVISEETSSEICQILEQVVGDKVEGTGKTAYVAGYRIGGKTGTTTDTVKEATEGIKEYLVSFIGIAPMDDPQICILVILDNPAPQSETGIYVSGGNMAAPTVGKMLADILPYMGVEAVYTAEEEANMDRSVPNLVGLTVEEAQAILSGQNLGFRIIGSSGTVTTQLPAPNSIVAARSEIIIYAGSEPSQELEEMPDLTGLTYDIARQRLGYYGLFLNTDSTSISDSSTIVISRQSVEAGAEVEHGTVITVTLVDMDTSAYGQY